MNAQKEMLNKILSAEISFVDNIIFYDIEKLKALFSFRVPPILSWSSYDIVEASTKPSKKKTVLTIEQERNLFLQFNYARFKVIDTKDKYLVDLFPEDIVLKRLIKWYEKSNELRSIIASYNMRLISNLMKKWSNQQLDIHELLSEGQMALLNAIDKFDTNLGKFSTYAYWAISHSFGRINKLRAKNNHYISSSVDEENVDVIDEREDRELAYRIEKLRQIIEENLASLNDNELDIIRLRYLENEGKRPSVEKISDELGIKKHKVSSYEKKALEKIRVVFKNNFSEHEEKIVPKEETNAIIYRKSEDETNIRRSKMTDEVNVETQEDAPAVEAPVAVEAPKPEKVQRYKILLDANGDEMERKPLGPGKPPKNSTKDADGNLVCPFVEKVTATTRISDYITLDVDGNVLHREQRKPGRGRPKKGFVKQTDGQYAGDYTMTMIADETPAVASQEAPEVVVAIGEEVIAGSEVEDNFLV